MLKYLLTTAACLAGLAGAAHANEFEAAMQSYYEDNLSGWATNPDFVAAIMAQNAQTNGFGQGRIDELDLIWRAQVGGGDAAMVEAVMSNAAAAILRHQVEAAGGALTEAFLMDAQGLNVAASHPTSDYWQGDEAKFQQTYLIGPDAVHFGDIELDQSTQTVQGQISMTIRDATGAAVGALTVGVNLTALM